MYASNVYLQMATAVVTFVVFSCLQLARSLSLSFSLAISPCEAQFQWGKYYIARSRTHTRETQIYVLRFTTGWYTFFFLFVTNFLFVEDSGGEAKYMALFSTNSFITNEWIFGGVWWNIHKGQDDQIRIREQKKKLNLFRTKLTFVANDYALSRP